MTRSLRLPFVAALFLAACAPPPEGGDAGVPDAADVTDASDASEPHDAGAPPDAGDAPDAAEPPDAGDPADAGDTPDAGDAPDAGPDLVPPETTLLEAPPPITNGPTATFAFASEPGTTFTCALDDAAPAPCTSPVVLDGLADGTHAFSVAATDADGNTDPTPATHAWSVDTVAPSVPAIDAPASPTNLRNARVTFATDDPLASTTCTLDDRPPAPCTSPFRAESLPDGLHTLAVVATDPAGNTSTPAVSGWLVDTVAPSTIVVSAPPALTGPAPVSLLLDSDDPAATFECLLDAGRFLPCTRDVQFGAGPGPHQLLVRAVDAAGNADPAPETIRWTVDAAPPRTFVSQTPPERTNERGATFRFASDDPAATLLCRTFHEGESVPPFAPCTSPLELEASDGVWTFEVRARDVVGNVEAVPVAYWWEVDATPPLVSVFAAPRALESSRTAFFAFAASEAVTTTCALDGEAPVPCSSPRTLTALDDGPHALVLQAVDAFGNRSAPTTLRWTVDATPPDTSIARAPASPTNATQLRLDLRSTEPGRFECALDAQPFAACHTPWTPTVAEGLRTLRVRAVDEAGNADAVPVQVQVMVDRTPPVTTIASAPPVQTEDSDATFTFAANETATFRCWLDGAAPFACASPVSFRGLGTGGHSFVIAATDAAGNTESPGAVHAWGVGEVVAPETWVSAAPSPLQSLPVRFTFGSVPDGASFECRLDAGAWTPCAGSYTVASPANGMTYTFEVRAVAAGVPDPTPAAASVKLLVPPPETFLDAAPPDMTGSRVSYTFSSPEPGATFLCSLDGAAESACTSPRLLTGLAPGSHSFAVRARGFGGTDLTAATDTFTVVLPDTTLTETPGTTGGTTASFSFSSNRSGATFECRLDAGAFTACASPQQYTNLAAGSHTFAVRALLDGDVDGSPATHAWTVSLGTRFRVMAANTSSGNGQSYEAEGIRLFQGLRPDVVLIQEFNVGDNLPSTIRTFVDTAFGAGFSYFRESGGGIPNGVISKFPIVASGEWDDDDTINDRDLVWAKLDLPGSRDLVAVSVHLKASSGSENVTRRTNQAQALVNALSAPDSPLDADDWLVVGGDLNTSSRTEPCMTTLAQVVVTGSPWPVDQASNGNTNASRAQPYDWVLVSSSLDAREVPVRIGPSSFPAGLVFDSRVYVPLSDVAPVEVGDSGVTGMQHMPVVREFVVPP